MDLGLVLPGHKAKDEDQWGEVVIPDRWKGKRRKDEVPRDREVILRPDGDAIIVAGKVIEKPFVEKPVDGEDHNVYIYHRGGGGRKLFRKVTLPVSLPRSGSDVGVGRKQVQRVRLEPDAPSSDRILHLRGVYQRGQRSARFSSVPDLELTIIAAEDIKVYTVGPNFSHAETRKSPVVDGLVRRNADGKETRFITKLTPDEIEYARDVVDAFGQRVCGFDLLRCDDGKRSMVIDVNGWSFVKGNQVGDSPCNAMNPRAHISKAYYDKAAEILSSVCGLAREKKALSLQPGATILQPPDASAMGSIYSTLRATVTVLRHADRTPKMKLKVGARWIFTGMVC